MRVRITSPWCFFPSPRFIGFTFLAALALAAPVFFHADRASAQTDQPSPAAQTQQAPANAGINPSSSMNFSRQPEATGTAEGEAKPAAPISEASRATPASLPHDLSPWGMFLAADIIVKCVMVGLAIASLITWTVALAKGLELLVAKRRVRAGLTQLAASPSLRDASQALTRNRGRIPQFVAAALGEAERSAGLPVEGIKERAAALLTRLEQRAGRAMTRGTGALATIGATAPFVGLFGTVWGIMNSFIGISKANTTNLAVVAPGIAEALLATALGLVAAIPAVVIYNLFARSITSYKSLLADASTEVMRHLSRDLDRQLFMPEDMDERIVAMRRSAE